MKVAGRPGQIGSHRGLFGAKRDDVHEVAALSPLPLATTKRRQAQEERRESPEPGKVDHVLIASSVLEIENKSWADLAIVVRRAQAGDREAFGELVEQFQPTVYAIALRRLGNPSDALEMTQEIFLHVLQRIRQLREPERFAGWLRQVAVRMAINRATRRLAPSTVESSVLEGAYESGDEPLDQLISRERAERLWEALGRLKSLDREALDAFYIRGHSLIEIAELLDVPLGTVKRRLHTARKRLKRALEESVADAREWTDGPMSDLEDEGEELELVGAGAVSAPNW
jgi:RNA polymerase sigma-70 factor, ECF subfamily